ncbi:MAG: hypothetical protein DCC71_12950 [Proteobacteria bacterium]|nr:MAG: hypothetical protein DCC71_12950 [Pseudomonadota bacterium]
MTLLCVVALAAAVARADLAAWDQAQVGAIARKLATASDELRDTFQKAPPPTAGSGQTREYHELKQDVRRVQMEARELAASLERGAGRDETLPIYESLMQLVRSARVTAGHVFTTQDVQQKASAAREALNQLSPYYDPDAAPLAPVAR